ncbi:MAG: RHS repeat-associated core domain-containing protein [Byssovorax sp.]
MDKGEARFAGRDHDGRHGGRGELRVSTVIRFQLGNHLGSAVLEVDGEGAVISYEEYHPYGTSAYRSGTGSAEVSLKRYRYTGKERDEETGLYYHRARYYVCWLGRWTSCDPLASTGSPNSYIYVNNNPMRLTDPSECRGREVCRPRLAQWSTSKAWEVFRSHLPANTFKEYRRLRLQSVPQDVFESHCAYRRKKSAMFRWMTLPPGDMVCFGMSRHESRHRTTLKYITSGNSSQRFGHCSIGSIDIFCNACQRGELPKSIEIEKLTHCPVQNGGRGKSERVYGRCNWLVVIGRFRGRNNWRNWIRRSRQ